MLDQLPTFVQLLKTLQQVPYLSSKSLYRVADYFLSCDKNTLEKFCATLLAAHENIKPCPICFCWYEADATCLLCSSTKRDQSLICVVETWEEMLAIEKTRGYEGVYHILGGVIYPLEGIGPDDLTIEPLVTRVGQYNVQEIILATNQTPEGEATAAYIVRKLKSTNVRISCLARGLPVGSYLKAMDRLTVLKALSERRPF